MYIVSISSSSAVIAKEKCSVYNKINQIDWRFYAHNTMLEAKGEDDWIKEPEYYDSIINVIGKAIGDCMDQTNEFCRWNRERLGNETIIFKDTNYMDYTVGNWNAVILYNAVNLMINGKNYRERNSIEPNMVIDECYDRIRKHYKIDEMSKNATEIKETLQKLKQTEKEIMDSLTEKYNNLEKLYERDKDSTDEEGRTFAEYHMRDMTCIKRLQKALKKFNADSKNIAYRYKDALDKLDAAHASTKKHVGNSWWTDRTLNDYTFSKIKRFLSQSHLNIAKLEMPKKLEKARNDMLKYSKALRLDEMLQGKACRLYEPGNDLFAKIGQISFGNRRMFEEYEFNRLFFCTKPEQIDGEKKYPVWKNEVYRLDFIKAMQAGDKTDKIYITGAIKFEFTSPRNPRYEDEYKEIVSYGYENEQKYADVLKLLQGLVEESLNKNEYLLL